MGNVIVLFEVTIKDGKMEDYLKMAAGLKDALSQAEGFIRSERFSSLAVEGKLLSMSAVSYTHLDVYKRQMLEIPARRKKEARI